MCSALALLLASVCFVILTTAPARAPVPDLVELAEVARSIEPLMYYSEHGVQYKMEVQAMEVALWDLGESLRVANVPQGPTICSELDELVTNLHTMSEELGRYLATVDGDIDDILRTMAWAQRELAALSAVTQWGLESASVNLHSVLDSLDWLGRNRTGRASAAGRIALSLLGGTPRQHTRHSLQLIFDRLLGVLEENLLSQLAGAVGLGMHYERVDVQLRNLQRLTVYELGDQERQQDYVLGSLWQRILGAKAAQLQKFERNRLILNAVRGRTTSNKKMLVDHESKLRALTRSLENVRRSLLSHLLRDDAGNSHAPLEDQIRGIADVWTHLAAVRQVQKAKVMEMTFSARLGALMIDGRQD